MVWRCLLIGHPYFNALIIVFQITNEIQVEIIWKLLTCLHSNTLVKKQHNNRFDKIELKC